ncbi:hypothetical protein [Amycolatopsis sp. NPDC021455]|uniref:hypothetical protein n=1 Tax=Amycolatopsis sp. NPDC021455 TaxID=3154901 RepID=UPI0033F4B3ED
MPAAGPENAPDVLDQTAPERDRSRKEQGVDHRTVEPFADVRSRGDGQQWCFGGRYESLLGARACFRAHAAPENHRVESLAAQRFGEPFDVVRVTVTSTPSTSVLNGLASRPECSLQGQRAR